MLVDEGAPDPLLPGLLLREAVEVRHVSLVEENAEKP